MKNLRKSVIMVLAVAVMVSCFSLPALALNQSSDKTVSAIESEANDSSVITRAPEYIRIRNTSGYNCYTSYGRTSAEGATIACQVAGGDYLLFIDGQYDSSGRYWVEGQIQGSHPDYGWYVWLLYDNTYMSIGY
ncbi:MAG: hypothetical protein VB064_10300 [Oscillospiraceae bacterium]|nr:hypothetical protein [Oscillospiraceae bacterium]